VDIAAIPQAQSLHVELDPTPILAAHARQRRRFAEEVGSLDATALATPSRCHKWTVADVLRHLCDVDSWMDDIWAGRVPPLEGFDPNITPHEFVVRGRAIADADVRDRFVASCEVMAADVEHSGPERWGNPSLSPLGAVPWWFSALHVFFDSWLHERDCLVPLGIGVPVEADEVTPVLTYIVGLAGLFAGEPFDTVVAGVRVNASAPPVVVTPVAALDGSTDLAAMADALSGRGDIDAVLHGTEPAVVRRLGALARFLEPAD
jgi:uncharacterized protein (TIGR03083 family)